MPRQTTGLHVTAARKRCQCDVFANYVANVGMASGADVPAVATQGVCPHYVLCMRLKTSLHRHQQGSRMACQRLASQRMVSTHVSSSSNAVSADDEVPKTRTASNCAEQSHVYETFCLLLQLWGSLFGNLRVVQRLIRQGAADADFQHISDELGGSCNFSNAEKPQVAARCCTSRLCARSLRAVCVAT